MTTKHEFFVDMTCEGCSGAVTRVLNKLGGVQFEIDLPNKKVFIESDKDTDVLLETLKKTGKAANYIGPNDLKDDHEEKRLTTVLLSCLHGPLE
uniref:Copper transport protein ATOX1 n=1 Tax=Esox lucius TaxID=8010 RepID=A0AAY5L3V0_ESOLU